MYDNTDQCPALCFSGWPPRRPYWVVRSSRTWNRRPHPPHPLPPPQRPAWRPRPRPTCHECARGSAHLGTSVGWRQSTWWQHAASAGLPCPGVGRQIYE